MPPIQRNNPYGAFNFKVVVEPPATGGSLDIAGLASFMECSGLDSENSPIEYREGTDLPPGTGVKGGASVRKLPGMERYPNIVLRRGITGSVALWNWRKAIRDAKGDGPVTTVRIILTNEQHEEVFKWVLFKAWPTKLSGPSLNAKGNDLAVEALELCCERIEVDTQ
jgi:phage tail-like protein